MGIEEKEEVIATLQLNDNKNTDVLELSPKMQRFIHMYLTGQYTVPKLADLLEVHPNTLWKWLKRKDVKKVIEDMQLSTHDVVGVQLKALTMKAVQKLDKLIDSPIDGVALQAVKDTLDRAGHKPRQEINVNKTVVTYEEKLHNLINNVIDVDDYVVEEVLDE